MSYMISPYRMDAFTMRVGKCLKPARAALHCFLVAVSLGTYWHDVGSMHTGDLLFHLIP